MPAALRHALLFLAALVAPEPARAACPDMASVARFAEAILERRSPQPYADLTLSDARCAQERLIAFLAQPWGDARGFKVALTDAEAQRRHGTTEPVRGTIFHATLRATSPARLPARFGAVPLIEAGLLVRIGRDGIAGAGDDPVAILEFLDEVIPFIELPDIVFAPGTAPGIANFISINAAARLGVVGAPIAVQATPALARALAGMTVVLADDRREIARAPGRAILGHPLNALAWLARDLGREGRALRAGDVVSLGGFAPAVQAEAGRTYTLRYEGLPGAAPVVVTLE